MRMIHAGTMIDAGAMRLRSSIACAAVAALVPLAAYGAGSDVMTGLSVPVEDTRACRQSVVLQVCAERLGTDRSAEPSNAEDDDRARLRRAFIADQEAQRYKIEYQKAHPDQAVVWGRTAQDAQDQGVRQFGDGVKKGVRPDCLTAYQAAGPLAALFILHDVVTDSGCH